MFVFLSAAAGAGIVGIDFFGLAALGRFYSAVIFVRPGYFGYLLTFRFLFHTDVHQNANRILLDAGGHDVEHLVACHLIFYQRISLAVGLESDPLTELIHIVDVVHPFPVDYL